MRTQTPTNSKTKPHHQQPPTTSSFSSFTPQNCPYCQMKRKFNIGGSNSQQKCLQHSMKINNDFTAFDQNSVQEFDQKYIQVEEMSEMLNQVQESLDYYWDNLREISKGDPTKVQKQLEPVLQNVKKVNEKISRFFVKQEFGLENSNIKQISHTTIPKKYNTGSQRFIRAQFQSLLDQQYQNSATESIKQWVMHFYKILQLRQLPNNINQQYQQQLPYQQQLQMRIFKQSMDRKFLSFSQQLQKYQNKVKDVLTKLIFYMQKSTVSEQQIQQDILFIQGCHQNQNREQQSVVGKGEQIQRMLAVQAVTLQCLLQGNMNMNKQMQIIQG